MQERLGWNVLCLSVFICGCMIRRSCAVTQLGVERIAQGTLTSDNHLGYRPLETCEKLSCISRPEELRHR
jgi:hypothetical protein